MPSAAFTFKLDQQKNANTSWHFRLAMARDPFMSGLHMRSVKHSRGAYIARQKTRFVLMCGLPACISYIQQKQRCPSNGVQRVILPNRLARCGCCSFFFLGNGPVLACGLTAQPTTRPARPIAKQPIDRKLVSVK